MPELRGKSKALIAEFITQMRDIYSPYIRGDDLGGGNITDEGVELLFTLIKEVVKLEWEENKNVFGAEDPPKKEGFSF